tara:strand:- start:917 stop:1456 length:540 start_codon:yes stop_codon:yes gene_type:complete
MSITIHPDGRIDGFNRQSMPSGSVIQVKSTSKTDTSVKGNVQSYDIPGLSVSITPTSASNKIFIIFNLNAQSSGSFGGDVVRLVRDSTNICIADVSGSIIRGSNAVVRHEVGDNYDYTGESIVNSFLDSPGDTNAHTYKLNLYDDTANNTVWINRDRPDSDSSGWRRGVSTITVMEIVT